MHLFIRESINVRKSNKIFAFVLAFILCFSAVIPVNAATGTQDKLEITVTTDKTSYSADETITATVNVKNNNPFAVSDISLDGIIPEGYKIANTEVLDDIGTLEAGAEETLTIAFVPENNESEEPDTSAYEAFKAALGDPLMSEDFEDAEMNATLSSGAAVLDGKAAMTAVGNRVSMAFNPDQLPYGGVVMEFDIEYKSLGAEMNIITRPTAHHYEIMVAKADGGFWFARNGGDGKVTFETGKSYRVTYAMDFVSGKYDAYIDGEKVVDSRAYQAKCKNFRTLWFSVASVTEGTSLAIALDNINIWAFGEATQ